MHAFAAALAFMIACTVQPAQPAGQAGPSRVEAETRSSAVAASAEALVDAIDDVPADQVQAILLVIKDPLRDETHPARNRQLVIPSGARLPALGRRR